LGKLFSVVIAAYNRENYLRRTIDSVLNQDFKDYEFIVVDDGSTDQTWDIIQSYGKQINSFRQTNQGSEAAFRKGASLATGKYIAFLDSDDLFLPNTLSVYRRFIIEPDPPALILGSMRRFTDENDSALATPESGRIEFFAFRDYLSKRISMGMAQSIIVIKRAVFEEIDKAFKRQSAFLFNYDYNLMLQAGTHGPCIILRRPVTVAYRQHADQNSRRVEKMAEGVLSLITMVRTGHCYGGRNRIFDKYAYLGGPIIEWVNKSIEAKKMKLAVSLLINGWPMIAAAIAKKTFFRFGRTAPRLLSKE
jgi:glycosyltransferase involved in cell wall biosynthesis